MNRSSQSGEILAVAGPWKDEPWAAIRGLKTERRQLRPATYFLQSEANARKLLGQKARSDEDSNPFRRPSLPNGRVDNDTLHIGVVRIGGKGDDLMTAATLTALKRRFPKSHITLFARDNTGQLAGHPALDRLVFGGNEMWRELAREVRDRFDIFIDLAYVPKLWVFRPDPELRQWEREWRERFEPLSWYYWNFPASNCRLGELGKNLILLANEVLGLEGDLDDVKIYLGPQDRAFAAVLKQISRGYIVLHNGSACGRQTKNWPTERWRKVAAWLKEQGHTVVQIGTANEEYVEGCLDLRGLTTVTEMAAVIEGAGLLLDTEGGPAHIAAAVGTRAVVLFGPTPASCFGYPAHRWVEAKVPCAGCWYRTDKWHIRCPEGHDKALCMYAIGVEEVKAAISEALEKPAGEKAPAYGEGKPQARACPAGEQEKQGETKREDDSIVDPTWGTRAEARDLAIAIPTRNRPEALEKLLVSIGRQSLRPGKILLINDGDDDPSLPLLKKGWQPAGPLEVIEGPRLGPHFSHQVALEYLAEFEFILRLDDDLVLESEDFIERLYRAIKEDDRVGAVGGVYPQPEWEGHRFDAAYIGNKEHSTTIAGMLRGENSAQFFRYWEDRLVEAEHLYSSFIYRRAAAREVGGFPLCYSARGHREETDFTYRIHLGGWRVMFDTGAVARHERATSGGLRDLTSGAELDHMRLADERLFLERLKAGSMSQESRV